jgi:ceramide glucosyltransferase
MHLWLAPLAWLFAALAACGFGYQFLVLAGIAKFRRLLRQQTFVPADAKAASAGDPTAATLMPPISILKPLRGRDPLLYEALRSYCLQDYPEFELIFGVADGNDPAVAEVQRLQREFPARLIKMIVCPQALGTNGKVSTLVQLLPAARHELILVNDSDILVPPDYLRKIAAGFGNGDAGLPQRVSNGAGPAEATSASAEELAHGVGLVTALYRGLPGSTLASRLEALTISTDFAASVLAAWVFERKLNFALGSTLAVRRPALAAIGGWSPLLNYLADDYELGSRLAGAGFEVALAAVVVETALPGASFREMFLHQLRWARTIRDRRLGGYLGFGISYAVPWALLACLCAGLAPWSLGLLTAVALLRLAVAAFCQRTLHGQQADLHSSEGKNRIRRGPSLWLLPLRDVVALLVWTASFAGQTIEWRGETFRLRHGRLEKI